jgi:starch synthase
MKFWDGLKFEFEKLFKKPLKVGIITTNYPDKKNNRGDAIHAFYLAEGLARSGCEVHVFTRGEKIKTKKEYLGEGLLTVHRIKTNFEFPVKDQLIKKKMSYFLFDNQVMSEILKENNNGRFDIIHSHAWVTAGAFLSKLMNNIRWIHTFHALEKERLKFLTKEEKRYQNINKWMESTISYADALICVSEAVRKPLLKNYPIKENRTFVVPNGVDFDLFNDGEKNKTNKVLCVTRLALEKGVDFLPQIIREVFEKNSEVVFELVAEAKNYSETLEKTISELKAIEKEYPKQFIWHKDVLNRNELSNLYRQAKVYIQPSRYESFGMAVLDAMAAECAVIASNRGGLPSVVGNAGITIPLNTRIFVKKILQLLSEYRWETVIKKTLDIYKLVSKKKTGTEPSDGGGAITQLEEITNREGKLKRILFICKYNRFRSKVAEAYLKKISKKKIEVNSVGIVGEGTPPDKLQSKTSESMGVIIGGTSKNIKSVNLKGYDKIIVVADDVPKNLFNGLQNVSFWNIPDEKNGNVRRIEKTIELIKTKIDFLEREI